MDRFEAKWVLLRKLVEYHRKPYAELQDRIGESDCFEATGPSGTGYQLEFQFHWDDRPEGDIRIIGSIDDGGWQAFCPMTYGTLVSPPKGSTK